MIGFDWDEFFTVFKVKMNNTYSDCTVGRYKVPKETEFPYLDIAIKDNSGGGYDLSGNEGYQKPLITIEVYMNGSLADSECFMIENVAKEIMLKYGFVCKTQPIKASSTDTNIVRWTSQYQRVFGSGDSLIQLGQ